ncbi:protein kinase domain-containing protein [Nonomuraea salmonea]|uniref:protein kinase domain-containing protein n=1 Tax=Nonomuraea salmonea TaxID=46181 RepID=UPI002FEB627A
MLGAGTTLNDRYVLGDRLGGGGMGEVWRADDTVLGRTVAVKVLMPALSEDPTFIQRFQNEARAMATLRHPGVVDVYDYGVCEVEGRRVSFLVMAYVEGESLDRVLRRGPLGVETTMRLVAEVAEALAAAHAQGIVHRDVKPANLMVRAGGGAWCSPTSASPTPPRRGSSRPPAPCSARPATALPRWPPPAT